MRFIVFKGEKSLDDLAARLFREPEEGGRPAVQAANKRAAAMLLKANPALKDVNNVQPGTLIAIPDNAPPLKPGETAIVPPVAREFTVAAIRNAVQSLYQRLDQIESSAAEKLTAGMDSLQSAEMRAAVKKAAGQGVSLAGRLPDIDSVAQDSKQFSKDMQAAQKSRKQALAQLEAALATLAKQ
jgi:hypothetical protein